MTSLHSDLVGVQVHTPYQFIQDTDPGVVGAGKFWLETDVEPNLLWRRNLTDDAWIAVGGSGGGSAAFSGARIRQSADLIIPTISGTALSFDSALYDTNSFYSAGNPTKLTIPVAGYYQIGIALIWDTNLTGYREVIIRINGTDNYPVAIGDAAGSGNGMMQNGVLPLLHLSIGDYVEVIVVQNSGSNRTITGDNDLSPIFWIVSLGT